MTDLWLRDIELDGTRVDVRVSGGRIAEIGPGRAEGTRDRASAPMAAPGPATAAGPTIDGRGGALIPGLWDHHLHLLAAAAARRSVPVGPPEVDDREGLAEVLRRADGDLPPGRWLRGVGYHETVAGHLARGDLDRLVSGRPVRLQHRSGAEWILNSVAVDRLGLDGRTEPGIERDERGRPTGRLYGLDELVRELEPAAAPDLGELGAELARLGIVGVTDTTPYGHVEELAPLAAAVSSARCRYG